MISHYGPSAKTRSTNNQSRQLTIRCSLFLSLLRSSHKNSFRCSPFLPCLWHNLGQQIRAKRKKQKCCLCTGNVHRDVLDGFGWLWAFSCWSFDPWRNPTPWSMRKAQTVPVHSKLSHWWSEEIGISGDCHVGWTSAQISAGNPVAKLAQESTILEGLILWDPGLCQTIPRSMVHPTDDRSA